MPDEEVMGLVSRVQKLYASELDANLKPEAETKLLKPKQLPMWPETDRAAPSTILRSALFRITPRKNRGWFKQQKIITSWDGYSISYTGEELAQDDLDVWLQILHMFRAQQQPGKIAFTGRGLLKALNRKGTGQRDLEWLEHCLNRLTVNGLTIIKTDGSGTKYQGPMIYDRMVSDSGRQHVVVINPMVGTLFDDGFTRLHWGTRLRLRGDLTKWMHGYVCSHRATLKSPSKIGLEKLQKLCGSERNELRKFSYDLRSAMSQLEENGAVSAWAVDDDVLSFVRPSQQSLTKSSTENAFKKSPHAAMKLLLEGGNA